VSTPGNPLSASIANITGVGPKLTELFAKKGIGTLEDALYFLPRAYEDRRHLTPMRQLRANQASQTSTVMGKVVRTKSVKRGRQSTFEVVLSDGTGDLILFWFHAYPALRQEFQEGATFVVYGEVKFFGAFPRMAHPEFEAVNEMNQGKPVVTANFGRIVPIYSETEGLHQKLIRRIIAQVLRQSLKFLEEPFPSSLRERLGLPSLRESFIAAHYPKEIPEEGNPNPSVKRIIFEEFFTLQLGLGLKKQKVQIQRAPVFDGLGAYPQFIASLPFSLTQDQEKVLGDIRNDFLKGTCMSRLLQGDVGSGKTVVALAGAVIAAGNGYQTCLLAPTEVLALQHFKTATQLLEPLGIPVSLLVHGTPEKKTVAEKIASGDVKVVVGTHAVLQEKINFQNLGLAIIDEQHRFGVDQRTELTRRGRGLCPHLLMTTATPIPRTLALTLYGDLDLSIIRQKPVGRKRVWTMVLRDRERPKIYQKIRETVGRGEQVFVIYPLVEQSEKLDLKSATEMHAHLSREVFPEFSIGLMHGRMKGDEKERILREFKEKKYSVLIATTVIEVGIDVPNATLMVIEHPERLGLSQLHQLRGRVGRGSAQSQCVLVADSFVTTRLKVMERTDDGFEIAEEDLKIRGPGEFLGTKQSGLPGFRVGHLLRDSELLSLARVEAQKILAEDPELNLPEHLGIRKMVESRWKEKIERLRIG
jgi:ATP-dependent DNA helicase RecG